MKKKLIVLLSFFAILLGSISLLSYAAFIINTVTPNIIDEENIIEGDEPVCYIGDIEFTSLDRALEYASSDSSRNDIVVIPGTNPSINRATSLSKEDYLYIPFRDMDSELEGEEVYTKQETAGIMEWALFNNTSTNDILEFTNTSKVTLNTDFTINGKLVVGATLYSFVNGLGQPYANFISGDYACFDINGHKVCIKSGGSIDSNGVLSDSGSGQIEIMTDGTLNTNFCVEDYHGGTNCSEKYDHSETPFLLYKLPYILCDIKVNYGSSLTADCCLFALQGYNLTNQVIFGSGGLIELESGYLIHKNINSSISSYKEQIDVYGNIKTNVMSIKVLIATVSIANVHFPISKYLDININNDSVVNVNTKIKVLPGSKITFNDTSKLVINSQISLYKIFKAQSEFSSVTNYKFYPDYGTYDPAYIEFNDESSLSIDKTVKNDTVNDYYPGLSGKVVFNLSSESAKDDLINEIKSTSNISFTITTSEGIGYPNYKILYNNNNFLDIYDIINEKECCIYKRFSNYYFEYVYDTTDSTTLSEIDMKTLNGVVIGKKEKINEDENASWDIKTSELDTSFIGSGLTSEYIDNILTIEDENNTTSLYKYDGSVDYFIVDKDRIIINYASNNIIVSKYDATRGIYTDGTDYYVNIDNTWAKFSLVEKEYIILNSDGLTSKPCYLYENGSWVGYTSYNTTRNYFCDSDNNYYILYNGKKLQINSSSTLITVAKKTLINTMLSAVDSDGNRYVYINGQFEIPTTFDEDNKICTFSEKTYVYVSDNEDSSKDVYNFLEVDEFYNYYLVVQAAEIIDEREYNFLFWVKDVDSIDVGRWFYGRAVTDDKLNYISFYTGNKFHNAVFIEDNDDHYCLSYEGYVNENGILKFYDSSNNLITWSSSISGTSKNKSDSIDSINRVYSNSGKTISINSTDFTMFSPAFYLYFNNEKVNVIFNTKYQVYEDEEGYIYGFYKASVKGDNLSVLNSKKKFTLRLQKDDTYEDLFYGTFTATDTDKTIYFAYATLLTYEEDPTYYDGLICSIATYNTDKSLKEQMNDLINEETDANGNTSYSIKAWASKEKPITHTLTKINS